jgi:hypothetical protein
MMSYPSDLTEVEWKKIKHPFEPSEVASSLGRRGTSKTDMSGR